MLAIAGVPGMVAGMLRHLHSLRRMKRDHGWIHVRLNACYPCICAYMATIVDSYFDFPHHCDTSVHTHAVKADQ